MAATIYKEEKDVKVVDTAEIAYASESLARSIREFCTQIKMAEAEIDELTKQSVNIEHQIERPSCKYAERARLATELQKVRRRRRELKDWLRINRPLIEYIAGDEGERAQRMIDNFVGVSRRVKANKAKWEVGAT